MIKKWVLKAIVQKTISFLPNGNKINRWFQKNVTKGINLSEEHFSYKFEHLVDHVNNYCESSAHGSLSDKICMELGTGWYPIIPIGYFLRGAEKTVSIDISPLITVETFLVCIDEVIKRKEQFFAALGEDIAERFEVLVNIQNEKKTGFDLQELCGRVNLELHIEDARSLHFEDGSFDLISSNNTFEHIYGNYLSDILKELWRTLKIGGVMSHFIDMSDHFAHMDNEINIYNFLKFSESTWQRIDNSIQPQNRWRFQQYVDLYEAIELPSVARKVRPGDPAVVQKMKISEAFKRFTPEQLAISHGYLVSRKE